jgi:hypothetical protein
MGVCPASRCRHFAKDKPETFPRPFIGLKVLSVAKIAQSVWRQTTAWMAERQEIILSFVTSKPAKSLIKWLLGIFARDKAAGA